MESLFPIDDQESRLEPERQPLTDLWRKSASLRNSKKFIDFINFVARFREYSVYNNALVFVQNPRVSFYATHKRWAKFGHTVKKRARPMVILVHWGPVGFVFDLADTEGPPLPDYLNKPFQVRGEIPKRVLELTLSNCARDGIRVKRVPLSFIKGGRAVRVRLLGGRGPSGVKVEVQINEDFGASETYATLCHELGHIYLGHLGNDEDKWWPDRKTQLTRNQVELEAESTSYLVCRRQGLETKSAQYLSVYLRDESDFEHISIDHIINTARRIERMGKERLPARKRKAP